MSKSIFLPLLSKKGGEERRVEKQGFFFSSFFFVGKPQVQIITFCFLAGSVRLVSAPPLPAPEEKEREVERSPEPSPLRRRETETCGKEVEQDEVDGKRRAMVSTMWAPVPPAAAEAKVPSSRCWTSST